MNKSITNLKEKLDKFPEIKYLIEGNSITVPSNCEKGFPVSFCQSQNNFTVSFKGWHEEFDKEEEAFACFKFGLSQKCRLKVLSRGKFEYKWILEHQRNNEWAQDSETGLMFFPFWEKENISYFQNTYFQD